MTKISVIIPAYNAEKYIAEAINSVLAQTYPVHEIIVVDDGSTDKTRGIVEAQGHKDARTQVEIKYIYQENKGPGAARNTGIKAATGEYIAFLDSDDTWMQEKIEKQMVKFKKSLDYGLIHANRIRLEPDGIEKAINKRIPEGLVFDELLMGNFIVCSSVLARKACFDETGIFDEDRNNKVEDYDMWLRIAKKRKIGYVNKPLIRYRVNPGGYNRSTIKKTYDSEKDVFLKALNSYYRVGIEKIKNSRLKDLKYRMGHSFFYAKDYCNASLSFWESISYGFSVRSISWYIVSRIMAIFKEDKSCQYA